MKTDSKPKSTYKAVPLTVSDRRRREGVKLPPGPVRSTVLDAGAAPVITSETKVTLCWSAPTYARHHLPDNAAAPSVVSGAECRPWVRYLAGTV